MNFSVTGEPSSELERKRNMLLQSIIRGGPGASRLLAAPGGRQGLARGYTANDSPLAAVPALNFNPFLAQLQRGVTGLGAPTANVRQQVSDLASQSVSDRTGAPAPQDLAGMYAAAGISPGSVGAGSAGYQSGLDDGTFVPTIREPVPPVLQQTIPFLRQGRTAF